MSFVDENESPRKIRGSFLLPNWDSTLLCPASRKMTAISTKLKFSEFKRGNLFVGMW